MNLTDLFSQHFWPAIKWVGENLIPASILDWYFMGKMARRNADGTRKPGDHDDEKEYRRVMAICKDRLEKEGEGEEVLVDEVDRLIATVSAEDAYVFRDCILLTTDEEQKILIIMDVAKAAPDMRIEKIRSVAQRAQMKKYIEEDVVGAYTRYQLTLLRGVMPDDDVDSLGMFTAQLKMGEHFQWKMNIGRIKDEAERLAAIQKITALPTPEQRYERARARGYFSKSLVRSACDKAGGWLNRLSRFYTARRTEFNAMLDPYAAPTQAWADRGADIANNPPGWNIFARGINFFRR